MMKTHLLESRSANSLSCAEAALSSIPALHVAPLCAHCLPVCRYISTPQNGLTKGGSAAVTLVVTAVIVAAIASLVALKRRRKAALWRKKSALVHNEHAHEEAATGHAHV